MAHYSFPIHPIHLISTRLTALPAVSPAGGRRQNRAEVKWIPSVSPNKAEKSLSYYYCFSSAAADAHYYCSCSRIRFLPIFSSFYLLKRPNFHNFVVLLHSFHSRILGTSTSSTRKFRKKREIEKNSGQDRNLSFLQSSCPQMTRGTQRSLTT